MLVGSWVAGVESGRAASVGLHLRLYIAVNCMTAHYFYFGTRIKSPDKSAKKRGILVLRGEESEVEMVVKRYAFKKICGNA